MALEAPTKKGGRPKGSKDKKPRKTNPKSLANLKKGTPAKFGEGQPNDLNPAGRRRQFIRVSDCILDLLEMPVTMWAETVPEEMPLTNAQGIARQIVSMALSGDAPAYRELLNRTEGKVPEEIIRRQAKQTPEEALEEYYKLEEEKRRILGEKY